jgi:hypothetical protein
LAFTITACLVVTACGGSSSPQPQPAGPVVNSADDVAQPPTGTTTLRKAIEQAGPGERITFDPSLNGGTIDLSIIGESHSILMGEVYAGGPPTYQGYSERDYGKSALYARKNVILDASSLPAGVTIKWTGGDANPARVLAVYGDLTLFNISITGGYSVAEALIGNATQPYTLARGGGIAVWGIATLESCAIYGNRILGDNVSSRDRGTYGGGIYSNGLKLTNCIVSGNTAKGYGAAGGGIYSVGGADHGNGMGNNVDLSQCAITGNRVTAQHAYGGGVFTLSGGPTNLATMTITNCTVARNVVEDNPDLLPYAGQYYKRGGGIYMGGGSLKLVSSTVAENEINGIETPFSGKSNMGGGGIAATIGNAHVVEDATVQHSIVIGNKKNGVAEDWFAGSILHFYSNGYNRIGVFDFSQILVPCPEWMDLSRKHYPQPGDLDGLNISDVVDLSAIHHHSTILSAGTDAGQPVVLWYAPGTASTDQIPAAAYSINIVNAGYSGYGVATDDFLNHLLDQVKTQHPELGNDFGSEFGDLTGTTWYGPAQTWPTDAKNVPWITFWRNLDTDIGNQMGAAKLNDAFWGTFQTGPVSDNVSITVSTAQQTVQMVASDQLGNSRPKSGLGDVGAVEK